MKYIAKIDTWFDEGTEVEIIDDYRNSSKPCNIGLFKGYHLGELDEEVCDFRLDDLSNRHSNSRVLGAIWI
jgi:hypothetical protein